jgi:hypothetical protein
VRFGVVSFCIGCFLVLILCALCDILVQAWCVGCRSVTDQLLGIVIGMFTLVRLLHGFSDDVKWVENIVPSLVPQFPLMVYGLVAVLSVCMAYVWCLSLQPALFLTTKITPGTPIERVLSMFNVPRNMRFLAVVSIAPVPIFWIVEYFSEVYPSNTMTALKLYLPRVSLVVSVLNAVFSGCMLCVESFLARPDTLDGRKRSILDTSHDETVQVPARTLRVSQRILSPEEKQAQVEEQLFRKYQSATFKLEYWLHLLAGIATMVGLMLGPAGAVRLVLCFAHATIFVCCFAQLAAGESPHPHTNSSHSSFSRFAEVLLASYFHFLGRYLFFTTKHRMDFGTLQVITLYCFFIIGRTLLLNYVLFCSALFSVVCRIYWSGNV